MKIKGMIARLSVLACVLFASGYVVGDDDVRMATHYPTVYGKVGESLKNPDNGLDFVDIDWADIDNYAGEDFGEASFTVDKTTLPKWLKWESVTTKNDKSKRVTRNPDDTTWWYSDGGKYYPISGTPTEAGTWNVKVIAKWSDGSNQIVTVEIIIKDVPKVVFDANGGKIGSLPKVTLVCDGDDEAGFTYIMPDDPVKSGGDFDGWWTAKEGGVQVQMGDGVDLSIFANPKTPTLYAQWRKACKITVSGGFLDGDDEKTSRSGLFRGDEVGVRVDEAKMKDKAGNLVNAFANWTYTPATANLGEGFDPFFSYVDVTMPNADVKLTANFVNGFAAYIVADSETQGEAEDGDFYWSVDNGKTLIPLGYGYPVKAGKVTVKFYDKKGNWRAADVTLTVDKRGTHKEGNVTYYDDFAIKHLTVKFVPVNGSAKVKLDANSGSSSGEAYFVNGYAYGVLDIPYRKGYLFAGWWTAKEGGVHITSDTIFDAALFAGQKTPTIYAHWLQFKKLTMKDESAYAEWYLSEEDFDPEVLAEIEASLSMTVPDFQDGGYLEGKGTLEVLPGAKVYVEVSDCGEDKNGSPLMFQKWTVTPSKADLGSQFRVTSYSTELTMPSDDVTLQATYVDESSFYNMHRLSMIANAHPIFLDDGTAIEPPYGAFEWSPDGGKTWYKTSSGHPSDDETGFFDYETGGWVDVDGDVALLKAGKYTITWRSTDPNWTAPDGKWWYNFWGEPWEDYGGVLRGTFSYVPQIVVDVMTFENGECRLSSVGGTATMNPKDGLVPHYKTITLTAKAAKNYAFQGWAFSKGWEYGNEFQSTSATWKMEDAYIGSEYNGETGDFIEKWLLESNIDPVDMKVHVVAVFKALSAYSADDIRFDGFAGWDSCAKTETDAAGNASVTVKAVAGCALDDDFALVCGPLASPLTYKLDGKLPDGLKFDAKTGVLSGAPKKAGNTSVTIMASDPAKNAKRLKVNFEVAPLPSWLVGEFRGVAAGHLLGFSHIAYGYPQQCGVIELSVKSDGKVSAKIITCHGTGSVSGTLSWADDTFWFFGGKNGWYCCPIYFRPDGTISGYINSYDKQSGTIGAEIAGMRQDKGLLADSGFLDKYYTFAFSAEVSGGEYYDESKMSSGYGYLTVKTDKTGGANITGQLPDGEKVSMSALVMPVETDGEVGACLYLFASPSAYKKADWFAMTLRLNPDGSVTSEDGAVWTVAAAANDNDNYYGDDTGNAKVFGGGALYSEAKTLEGYYWTASCAYSDQVKQQFAYKEGGWTEYYEECALDFDGFFNVAVKGDKKGAISLVEKSPAPWVEDGEWNYWEDKKGNEITDPSQLSISFTKATGIFTGKASVYFNIYPKPTSASLPYSGVMIYDGNGGYVGLGAAVHTYKVSYIDYYGKTTSDTKKVSLPVSLDSVQ